MSQIILDKPHTHGGVLHAIGAELDVLLRDAEWLVAAGVARFKQGVQRGKNNPPESEARTAAGEPAAATASPGEVVDDAPSPAST